MDLHGGNIYKYSEKITDYSANINPLGVPKGFKKLLKKEMNNLVNYPEPNYNSLKEAIKKEFVVPLENIIVGNGATELIFLFIKAINPKKTLILAPTFAEYTRALESIDSEIHYFPYTESNNEFLLDIEKLKVELDKNYELVIICNPNNPTGSFLAPDFFVELLAHTSAHNTKLLVDEAFIDFMKDYKNLSVLNLKNDRIFITRAFTKFFAIPGIRAGYGFCFDKNILEKISKIKEPWSLNSFASITGNLFEEKSYIKKTYKWLDEEKVCFIKKLNKISGITVFKTNTNFILIKLHKISGSKLKGKLINFGFLIRQAKNFEFLDDSYIRIAIKDKSSNKKFVKALEKAIGN